MIEKGQKKPVEPLPARQAYIRWLRHWELFTVDEIFKEPEPYMLYRGLKSIYYVIGEITRNKGIPLKGASWVTTDYSYAVKFGPAYVLHIDPVKLGKKYKATFIKDKSTTFTTGFPVNLYACMFTRSKQNMVQYLLSHFPELKNLESVLYDVLEYSPKKIQ